MSGLTLQEIAQQTRISTRFLRAIEDETFDELPGGLFNRGFVRAYSEAVGLDPEAMVQEYTALTEQSSAPAEEPQPPAPEGGAATTSRRFVLPAAVGGLVVLVFVLFAILHGRDSVAPTPAAPKTASARASSPTLPPAPVVSRPIAPLPTPPLEEAHPEGTADGIGTEPARQRAEDTITPSLASTSRPLAPAESAAEIEDVTEAPDASSAGVAADTGAVPGNDDSVLVRLEVHDSTWMYVELDGEVKYDIRINPPFSRNYTVREALELKIGNPAGVSLSVNGQPVTSLGPSDQVWSATITPENAGRLTGSL